MSQGVSTMLSRGDYENPDANPLYKVSRHILPDGHKSDISGHVNALLEVGKATESNFIKLTGRDMITLYGPALKCTIGDPGGHIGKNTANDISKQDIQMLIMDPGQTRIAQHIANCNQGVCSQNRTQMLSSVDEYVGENALRLLSKTQTLGSASRPGAFDGVGKTFLCHTTFPAVITDMSSVPALKIVIQYVCYYSSEPPMWARHTQQALLHHEPEWFTYQPTTAEGTPRSVKVDMALLGDPNSRVSVFTALNNTMPANGSYIWFDPYLTETQKNILKNITQSPTLFKLHGASLGAATAACVAGAAPVCYTGFLRSWANLPAFTARISDHDPFGIGKEGDPFQYVPRSLNIVENVDQIPYKVAFAIERKFPLLIPAQTELGKCMQKTLLSNNANSIEPLEMPYPPSKTGYLMSIYSSIFTLANADSGSDFRNAATPICMSETLDSTFILAALALSAFGGATMPTMEADWQEAKKDSAMMMETINAHKEALARATTERMAEWRDGKLPNSTVEFEGRKWSYNQARELQDRTHGDELAQWRDAYERDKAVRAETTLGHRPPAVHRGTVLNKAEKQERAKFSAAGSFATRLMRKEEDQHKVRKAFARQIATRKEIKFNPKSKAPTAAQLAELKKRNIFLFDTSRTGLKGRAMKLQEQKHDRKKKRGENAGKGTKNTKASRHVEAVRAKKTTSLAGAADAADDGSSRGRAPSLHVSFPAEQNTRGGLDDYNDDYTDDVYDRGDQGGDDDDYRHGTEVHRATTSLLRPYQTQPQTPALQKLSDSRKLARTSGSRRGESSLMSAQSVMRAPSRSMTRAPSHAHGPSWRRGGSASPAPGGLHTTSSGTFDKDDEDEFRDDETGYIKSKNRHAKASFFGDLWGGIKSVGKGIAHGVEDVGHDIVSGVKDVGKVAGKVLVPMMVNKLKKL